ncbi:hypothetical protein AGMMS49983_01050 [Clostridia bacterium]|nr:hypothetical protein AGMMS49983_01050 [Clostridia bacterium]
MTYRQNVIDALDHKQTQLTPWAFETTAAFRGNYIKQYPVDDVEADLESNIMFGKYKRMSFVEESVYEDVFGVHWKLSGDGGDIGMPINHVMNIEEPDKYIFPKIDTAELEKGLAAMRADTRHFRMFRMTYTMFERAWSMTGMMELMIKMAEDEKHVLGIFEKITEYQHKLLDAVLDEEFEGVYFGDDWGQQKGLLIGPAHFRTFIKPFMKELTARVKSKGKYVLLHSCGDLSEILPDLIEIGIDAYNTVQPEVYDLQHIKNEYGKDLTFWGAISTQQFLPFHSAAEVFEKSVETIRILGKGGGYLFSPTHAIPPDVPPENARTMLDAVKSVQW